MPPTARHPLRPVAGSPEQVWEALCSWWEAPDGPLAIRTSGTTGAPTDVLLSRDALAASADATHRRLGGPGRWRLQLPVTSVAGLQVLVRSLVAGVEPLIGAASPSVATARAERLYTSLVPTQLYRLERTGSLASLAELDAVLVGGAATDVGLLAGAAAAGVRVVTTYGMTETCGGCVYDGLALDGVAVRISTDGRIQLAGPVLFEGYADDPQATAEVLRDGWLRTGDLGRLDDDGRLEVLGRADGVVLTGGVSVQLAAVEAAVLTHPALTDGAVIAVDDPEWGSRVVAVVVSESAPPTLAELRDHVTASLPRTWAPRGLLVVGALPRLPGGKVDRLMVRLLGSEEGSGPR